MDPSIDLTRDECHGVMVHAPTCGVREIESLVVSADGCIESLIEFGNFLAIAVAKALITC